jgi:SPP1 gp7 family putative phage head morphogenesis protein
MNIETQLHAAFRRGLSGHKSPAAAGESWAEDDPQLPRIEARAIRAVVLRWRQLRDEVLDIVGLTMTKAVQKSISSGTFAFEASELVRIISRGEAFSAAAASPNGPLIESFLAAWARGWANAGQQLTTEDAVAAALQMARAEIANRGLELVRNGTARTLRDQIVAELTSGAYDGQNPIVVAQRLRQRFAAQEYNWERLARTETAIAQSDGKLEHYRTAGITEVDYVTADDDRVSTICRTLEARNPYPINAAPTPGRDSHPNCFPAGTVVAASGLRGSSARWYRGQVVEIRTASGQLVTVTPNHPILTGRGWIAAQAIQQGDHVFRSAAPERVVALIGPDDHHTPAMIEQVAESLGGSFAVPPVAVPTTAVDFHGDGTDSDVDVVRPDRFLADSELLAAHREERRELTLTGMDAALHELTGGGSLDLAGHPHDASLGRTVGSPHQGAALIRRRAAHAREHALAAPSRLDSLANKESAQGWSADADGLGDRLLALAGLVSADQVTEVCKLDFAGHVYNLETETGWYFANGIVSHNCRCTIVARIPD